MSSKCALNQDVCDRLPNTAKKSVCKAKGISGYSRLKSDELTETCCKQGGLYMPENFKSTSITLERDAHAGKSDKQIMQTAFRSLLTKAKQIHGSKKVFGSKRRSCFAGSVDIDEGKLIRSFGDSGAMALAEDGTLDIDCVKKCQDMKKNYTCGVVTAQKSESWNDENALDVVFFGNYPEGIPALKKTYEKCKNDLELFWDVMDAFNPECNEGDLYCDKLVIGSNDYGSRNVRVDMRYECKNTQIYLSFTDISSKYSDLAYGDEDHLYDEFNYGKFERNKKEIKENFGIYVPVSDIKEVFGDQVTIAGNGKPKVYEEDKSFSVDTSFKITYPALTDASDTKRLNDALKSVRSKLGKKYIYA